MARPMRRHWIWNSSAVSVMWPASGPSSVVSLLWKADMARGSRVRALASASETPPAANANQQRCVHMSARIHAYGGGAGGSI
eukprot:scaffold122327_cov63-Phaeocystis_antarctica.AAC.1